MLLKNITLATLLPLYVVGALAAAVSCKDDDNEANCSSNVTILDGTNTKVCVPPSSGI